MNREIPVVISAMGHCSAAGQGLNSLRLAWLDGILPVPTRETVLTANGPVDVFLFRSPNPNVPTFLPAAVERRMSRFAKMCFVTVAEALAEASVQENPQRTGLVVGTAFGFLDLANTYQKRIVKDGPAGASPSLFAASIHNSLAAQLTLTFNIRGPNSTVSTMEQTSISAFRLAYDWIQHELVDRVIVCLGDELSEFHVYWLAHQGLDFRAGEGAMTFVLERQDRASKIYAQISAPQLSDVDIPAGLSVCHSRPDIYGTLPIGNAFEMALAALSVERDGKAIACIQKTPGLAHQSIIFKSN